jgi:carbamate kinase
MASIGLGDAMLQAVEALAATRAEAARQGLRACGAEALLHVMPVAMPHTNGQQVGQLVLAPPDSQEGPHSSTVTLTLAGDGCDTPEPPPARRR